MFVCTDQTETECLERMLFGAPQSRLPEMKQQIKVGSTVFLYNKEAKVVMGPYSATVEPGWKLAMEEGAWSSVGKGSGFPAQVRVRAQGTAKRLAVRKRDGIKAGPMTTAQVEEQQGTQLQGKPIKGVIQVQTQLTWPLAFTGPLAILINSAQLPRRDPAARPAARVLCEIPPLKPDCARAQISSGHLGLNRLKNRIF